MYNKKILPWKWLKIEWDILDDQFSNVNPWDILMTIQKSTSNSL